MKRVYDTAMVRAAVWMLAILAGGRLGLACDTARPPGARSPPVHRDFPETADFRSDSNLGHAASAVPAASPTETARPPAAGLAVGATPPSSPRSDRVAAVLLMLPADAGPAGARGVRTYKVSLGPDLVEARVEIDGADAGSVPVRRVYPQPGVVEAAPGPARGAVLSGDMLRARAPRRAGGTPLPATQLPFLNPNGAPIID